MHSTQHLTDPPPPKKKTHTHKTKRRYIRLKTLVCATVASFVGVVLYLLQARVCLPACLPASLPPCLPPSLPACLPACPSYPLSPPVGTFCLPACLPSCPSHFLFVWVNVLVKAGRGPDDAHTSPDSPPLPHSHQPRQSLSPPLVLLAQPPASRGSSLYLVIEEANH